MRTATIFRAKILGAHGGSATWVIAASLALGAPQVAWAQASGEDQPPVEEAAGQQVNQSSQDTVVEDAAADEGVDTSQIVVTGTLLRGAPPVGSNLISVGEERIQATGATTANELMATIPQVSNLFNTVPNSRLNVASNNIQVVRPNLRNLTLETSSANATLVLFDGHRVANIGVSQQGVDPDLIPPGAIERVEVVTDGGSSTYGADAVGGVINFITRKRFDGLKVDGRYGFADDYYQWDVNATAGKDWGDGSLFASFSHQRNDALFGRDRDFIRQIDTINPANPSRGFQCSPGNFTTGAGAAQTIFPLLATTPATAGAGSLVTVAGVPSAATANRCDLSDNSSFVPRARRYGALVGLHQELSDAVTVDLRAYYGERTSTAFSPFTATVGVPVGNPFRIPGTPAVTQSVSLNFEPVVGRNPLRSITSFEEWGANAEFQVDLNDNFRLRQLFNYSRSNAEFHILAPNVSALTANANAGAAATINFFNPAATPTPILALLNNEGNSGQGKSELANVRTIIDGTLFTLPGGDVKVAVGYEYIHEGFQRRTAANFPVGGLDEFPYLSYSRRSHSAFGEVQVPIVGADNRVPGIYSLVLAGSARYDHFSDFGSTTNPKIGVTYKPVSWLGLRGNYSTSFNAPSVVDQLAAQSATFNVFTTPAPVRPGDTPPPGSVTLSLFGAGDDLTPQTADIYSFGFDIDPPFLEGLHASASYYNVKYSGLLANPPAQNPALFYSQFLDFVTLNPTIGTGAVNNAFLTSPAVVALNSVALNPATLNGFLAPGSPLVYNVVDFRTRNFGTVKVEGIDFAVNYRTSTSFGGVDAGVSGNYQLTRDQQSLPGAAVVDLLTAGPTNTFPAPKLSLQATLGADVGNFRAQATLNHTSGFKVFRNAASLPQDRVGDFDTVNLFFKYDVPGESLLLRDLSFTVNINNVLDEDPPISLLNSGNSNISGFINGFTLGRLFQFGVSKKF